MKTEELYKIYLENPSMQTDTRRLKPGDFFFALKGPSFNGNAFAAKAIEQGAVFAVIDEKRFEIEGKTILVDDVLIALQQLALHHRKQFSIPFIAITGSNGKTTTKELVSAVLSTTFKTSTTEGNLNNHIGIPLTILKIKRDTEIAVIEMGANHAGEIASYCEIARPTHGIITNCGKAHLEGFGSEEGVRKAKGELFDYLRTLTHGYAFVMWDYDYLQQMSKGISGIIKYGTKADSHVVGSVYKTEPFLEISVTQGFDAGSIKTQLIGDYNLPNVLAAVTVGKIFKVPEEKIKRAIEKYTPSNSRSQFIKKGTNRIVMDAYNANPSSMKAAIENFAKMPGEKILVLGSMAELGRESTVEHESLIRVIGNYKWRDVLLVGDEFKKTNHAFRHFDTADEAKKWLAEQKFEHASLLIKGSRSMKMENVID